VVREAQLAAVLSGLLENLSQGPRWASHLADSGRPMIVLVASRDPCVATGTGRANGRPGAAASRRSSMLLILLSVMNERLPHPARTLSKANE
jgi:hypothetical protein